MLVACNRCLRASAEPKKVVKELCAQTSRSKRSVRLQAQQISSSGRGSWGMSSHSCGRLTEHDQALRGRLFVWGTASEA
ncbi:hypothetical protein WJX74_005688 [Apatococcus lobatus]|uniref:Uncharacterized protein n=1 Tax=Apatococcus lobatus TaxID=904363 RepID=A0AAW1R3Q3_9CHLO